MRALSIASTGMLAQQTNVEVIANNLANMNTTGFKQQRAEFQDLLYQTVQTPGSQTSDTGAVVAQRHPDRRRRQDRRGLPCHHPGRPEKHQQSLRCRDPGPGLFPHPTGRWQRRPLPRRQFQPVAGRPAGHAAGPGGAAGASPSRRTRCRCRSTPRAR